MNARSSRPILSASIAALILGLAGAMPWAAQTAAQPDPGSRSVDSRDSGSPAGPDQLAGQVSPTLLDVSAQILPAPELLIPEPAELQLWVDEIIAQAPAQDDPFDIVDTCMAQDMAGGEGEADDTPGASLAISQNGELVYSKGYGLRQAGGTEMVDPETAFRIGSTTKQLTAAALMQLVDAGKVELDAPITDYLPDLELAAPYQASDLTSHHLLTHSSGIPDQLWILDPSVSLADWTTFSTPQYQLHAPPGSFWNYSNPNFNIAGMIVEQIGGQPYYDYMAEQVFARAAMTHTTFYSAEVEARGNYALGLDAGSNVALDRWDVPGLAPAGTAFSTPSDMVRWANLLTAGGGDVISPESAAAMQEKQMPIEIYGWDHYGYGIMVTDMRDSQDPEQIITVYDHGGNIQGFSSQLFWVPERGFAVSILANTMRSLSSAAYCALQVVAGVSPQSGAGLVTTPDTWGPHVGTYAMANNAQWPFTAQVSMVSDTLHLDYTDIGRSPIVGRDFPMIHGLRDTFLLDSDRDGRPDGGLAFTFIRDRDTGDRVTYIRDRYLVGHRVGQIPGQVSIEGETCTDIEITAERDMPELQVTATGLSSWGPESGLALAQDDPADPSSASFKRDIRIEGGADLFWLGIIAAQSDSIASYLMQDIDGNGEFSFPSELAVAGVANAPYFQLLYATEPLPPGDYQLWIHGLQVADDDAGFDLLPLTTEGAHLRLENVPESLTDGQQHSLQVCAQDIDALDSPAQGSVTLRYGQPPRLVRVMVDWAPEPEAPPTPTIYLPSLSNGQAEGLATFSRIRQAARLE